MTPPTQTSSDPLAAYRAEYAGLPTIQQDIATHFFLFAAAIERGEKFENNVIYGVLHEANETIEGLEQAIADIRRIRSLAPVIAASEGAHEESNRLTIAAREATKRREQEAKELVERHQSEAKKERADISALRVTCDKAGEARRQLDVARSQLLTAAERQEIDSLRQRQRELQNGGRWVTTPQKEVARSQQADIDQQIDAIFNESRKRFAAIDFTGGKK